MRIECTEPQQEAFEANYEKLILYMYVSTLPYTIRIADILVIVENRMKR